MLALLLLLAAPGAIQNARLESRVLRGPLDAAIAGAVQVGEASWVAWGAPLHGRDSACCGPWGRPGGASRASCRLESSRGHSIGDDDRPRPAPQSLMVFVRIESGAVERIRPFTDDCPIDAESRRVVWLEGVSADQSVAYLRGVAHGGPRQRAEDALSALALHGAPEAVPALLGLARSAPASDTRGQALFWLAQRAGAEARAAITRAIEEDPETDVKRQAVFALSEMPADEGIPLLIDLARRHANPAVREQAFFWLGESQDPRALRFFEEVLR